MRRSWKSKTQALLPGEPRISVERKRTTTFSRETQEVFVITRPSQSPIRSWCEECATEVDMLRPEEAAAIVDVNIRTIYQWIETARIHHAETETGNVVVCPTLLFQLPETEFNSINVGEEGQL